MSIITRIAQPQIVDIVDERITSLFVLPETIDKCFIPDYYIDTCSSGLVGRWHNQHQCYLCLVSGRLGKR